jgi:hypothetical protein
VVANAGVTGTAAPIADYPEDDFDHTLAGHVIMSQPWRGQAPRARR